MAATAQDVRNRLAIKATIRRASAKARAQMNALDAEYLRDVHRAYRAAAADLRARIEAMADQSGNLRLQVMQDLLRQVNARLDQLGQARDEILNQGMRAAAAVGVSAYAGAVPSTTLVQSADDALRVARNFVSSDGLQLSDRLWRLDNGAKQAVADALQSAIIQGHSATQAAQDFLSRGQPVPGEVQRKIDAARADKLGRQAERDLLTGDGNPTYNAQRVFRTELNRAHGEAYMAGGETVQDFAGWRFLLSPAHPAPDICDMHARANLYGLGPGVYPSREKCPWPAHPNTLSYTEIVFKDEITAEDRAGKQSRLDWLEQQPPHVQEGVLGARKKRAALQAGILKENQIATPWRVLKDRYAAQGIDVQALKIKPVTITIPAATPADVAKIQAEAWQYVADKGAATGHEHAVIYDINTGQEFIRKTSRRAREVKFDRTELSIMADPRNRLELVHNHPSSSSLSGSDLGMGSLPGVHTVVAVGHDGSTYISRTLVDGLVAKRAWETAMRALQSRAELLISADNLGFGEVGPVITHAINTALGELQLIDYQATHISGGLRSGLATLGTEEFARLVARAKKAVQEKTLK